MNEPKAINEYLSLEFGVNEVGDSAVTENWPFELSLLDKVKQAENEISVFKFEDANESYFVFSPDHDFYPMAGMTLEDLRIQMLGTEWIARRMPVNLETALLNDETVPSTKERRVIIQQLAAEAVGEQGKLDILEGLYLKSTGSYFALLGFSEEEALIVGTTIAPLRVAFPAASAWRRLSYGVGKLALEKLL